MTQLLGGKRVRKDHPQVEAYGTVDDLPRLLASLCLGTSEPR